MCMYAYTHIFRACYLVLDNQLICSSLHVLLIVTHKWKNCKLLVPILLEQIILFSRQKKSKLPHKLYEVRHTYYKRLFT